MNGPNPFSILGAMLRARRRRRPHPVGSGWVDHSGFNSTLTALVADGVSALRADALDGYVSGLGDIDPDSLGEHEALAYWINLYNAGALDLARRARDEERGTVLRVSGGFTTAFVTVAGERLSLHDVEHGKIRRFGDPRVHAALVCGSVSCPTLRAEPYQGDDFEGQLDEQMRHFLAAGGVVALSEIGEIALSRVFRWYGGDFVHPDRMPTLAPVRASRVLRALEPWLDERIISWASDARAKVRFQKYDWALGCAVRAPTGESGAGG